MDFMEKIYPYVKPLWEASYDTSFVKEMLSGELSKEKFQRYMEQDTMYLLSYTKLCAKAITNAKSEEEIRIYASMIAYVNGTEWTTRKEAKANESNILLPATENYINFLMEVYEDVNNKRIFLVLVNCMLSYDFLFSKLAEQMREEDTYWFFVKDYASKEYRDFCDRWIRFMNQIYKDITEKEWEEALHILKKACFLEYDFWEMAYTGK